MAIRVRMINGEWIALCAARSTEKEGDLYLDDGVHYALARKFCQDYEHTAQSEIHNALRAIEESNNPNRDDWDKTFGQEAGAKGEGK